MQKDSNASVCPVRVTGPEDGTISRRNAAGEQKSGCRRKGTGRSLFTLIELLVNTSQHNCFSLLLKSPQLP